MTQKGSPEDKIAATDQCLPTDFSNTVRISKDSTVATKMSCGRTTSKALAQNVLAPYSPEHLATEMQDEPYFTVCFDASNSGNELLCPYT